MDAYDQDRLRDYSDAAYEAAVDEAQQQLAETVANNPVVRAAARLAAAQVRRSEVAAEMKNTATRLGIAPPVASPPAAHVNLVELTERVISEQAHEMKLADQERAVQARAEAGE